MYEIKAEDTFIQDVNRWSKKVTELWDEIQAITSYMQENGEIPEEYDPHLLTNEELNYVGYFEIYLRGNLTCLLFIQKTEIKKSFDWLD